MLEGYIHLGMGVQSSILPIFMPALAKALRADWAPGPGVLVRLPPELEFTFPLSEIRVS